MENLKGIPKLVLSLFGKELRPISLILRLYAIILLGAVIRCLQPFSSGMPNEAAKLGINGIIILSVSVSFGSIAEIAQTQSVTAKYCISCYRSDCTNGNVRSDSFHQCNSA